MKVNNEQLTTVKQQNVTKQMNYKLNIKFI